MPGILNAELAIPQFPALDQYGPNTTLLLHGDGTNGAQNNTFLDSSANNFTITRNGNTTQGTFSPFSQPNGYWSNYFNNSGYLYNSSSNSISNFGTGNYTVEAWFYMLQSGAYQFIYDGRSPGGGVNGFALLVGNGNTMLVDYDGSVIFTGSINIQTNKWYHVVACRGGTSSNQAAVFVNGTRDGRYTDANSYVNGYNVIGAGADSPLGAAPFYGYISNFRIVKGTDVYGYSNTSITVPTTPLTAITNTTLLTCQSNRFVDNSASQVTFTISGTPSVQAFHPISAPTAYYPAVNGGGGYFDGSGDYLATPTTSQPTATGDFTISCWFYLQSFGANYYAVGGNWTSGTSGEWLIQIQNNGTIRFLTTADGTFAGTVRLNEWTYFSASRSGTTVTVQLNGSTIRTYTLTGTLGVANETINIGQQVGNNWPWNGYIADFNFNTTTATTAVPTLPASVVSGTSLLLKFQNAGIIDSVSQNQLETVGNAQVSTTQSKFGGASMSFNGSTDYLKLPSNPALGMGSGDFTIEAWIYPTTVSPTYQGIFSTTGTSSSDIQVQLNNNLLRFTSYTVQIAITTSTISANQWTHIAVCRFGGTTYLYINGNLGGSGTDSTNWVANPANIGAIFNSSYPFSGYIDDFRVTKGIARYTQNFTPPQNAYPNYGPLTNIPTVDPNFKNTPLLLHGNGTNGAQNNTFLDSSTNNFTITRNGNTTQGTFTPFSQPNGWWSNYFDGTGNSVLTLSNNAAFNLSSGSFTIEAWINPFSNGATYKTIASNYSAVWEVGLSGQSLYWWVGGTVYTTTITVPYNSWSHIAISSNGTNVSLFINGILDRTVTATPGGASSTLYIGKDGTTQYFPGYISNFRIVKGTQVYTSNFTPSSLPLTAITNTSLLTCQSNRFVDNSSNAFAITAGVTTTPQNFYPFFPPLDYSTAAIGGSAYLDGSGDYLSSSVGAIGTGNFTVEFYSYWDNTNASTGGYFQISTTSGGLSTTYTSGLLAYSNSGTLSFFIGSTFYGTTYTIVPKQWIHIAIVRSSGTVRAYVNGVSVLTPTTDTTNISATYLALGGYYSTSYLIPGYLSNFRVLIGTALYTSNFTPPTAPLTAITNTSFLLSATNGGIFDNAAKNNLETVGSAQISTTQSKFGGSSMSFTGTSNYLVAKDNPIYSFGTGDFTVECWIYLNTLGRLNGIWTNGPTSTGSFGLYVLPSNAIEAVIYGASGVDSSITLVANTWYHVAASRSGSTLRVFINGVQSAINTSYGSNNTTSKCVVGDVWVGYGAGLDGYIDDLRITNGVSRYNYNFTPPAAQFPNK